MNCRVAHHFLDLLLLFCIADLCIVQALNISWTFSTSPEFPKTTVPVTDIPGVKHTVTPTAVPGSSIFAVVQQASTSENNSSANWKNNSEVTSVANFSDFSTSTVSSVKITSWRNTGNISHGSTIFSSGKSSSTLSSAAWTTDRPTGVRNESNLTLTLATNEYLTKPTYNTDRTLPDIKTYNDTYAATIYVGHVKLKHSEAILTIAFSIILFTVLLVILIYNINKCKTRRRQYSHRPLDDTSYDSVNQHLTPEDTLVISGGLYDAQRVYNPNMTVLEDEEGQHDFLSFASKPGQFRLEFLPGEKEAEIAVNGADINNYHLPNHSS